MEGNASSMNHEKKAEEALHFQANILKIMDDAAIASFHLAILESARDPMWVTDSNLTIIYWNDAAADTFGWTADEAMGRNTGELFKTHVVGSTYDDAVKKLLQEGDFFGEVVCHCKDGHPIVVEAHSHSVRGSDGEVVRVVSTVRDITERMQVEEKVREAAQLIEYHNRKLNAVIQSLPHGLVIYDINANPIFYNEQALKGYTNAIKNKDIPFAQRVQAMGPMHKEGGSAATEEMPIMRALKGEVVRDLEMSYTSRSGERVWVSSTTAPIISVDGEINEAVATYVDITERKRAEEALRESEEKYRTLFTCMNQGFALCQLIRDESGNAVDYRYLEVNPSMERMLGLTNVVGKTRNEIFPDRIGTEMPFYARIDVTNNPVVRQEYKSIDGRWYDISSFARDADQFAVLFDDITDRKRAEEALRGSEEQAHLLAGELDKKNRLVTDFFINVSHEFKTPLTILMMGLDLLETKAKKVDGGKAFLGNLTAMKQNSYRLNRLVANLLDITKLDAGFMQPKWERADLAALFGSLAQSVEPFVRQRQLALEYVCDTDEIPFTTDGFMLERIVLNLLSNAIKHTPAGGRIVLTCRTNEGGITISVKDTGEGIPEDKKALIFDRFSQVDTKMTRSSEGTGIGLALIKSFVELLGGTISVESTLGTGSTFTVELPAIQIEPAKGTVEQGGMQMEKRVQMELSGIIST